MVDSRIWYIFAHFVTSVGDQYVNWPVWMFTWLPLLFLVTKLNLATPDINKQIGLFVFGFLVTNWCNKESNYISRVFLLRQLLRKIISVIKTNTTVFIRVFCLQDKTWIEMPKWTICSIISVKQECLCSQYWVFLT